jgi:hypothetical protein
LGPLGIFGLVCDLDSPIRVIHSPAKFRWGPLGALVSYGPVKTGTNTTGTHYVIGGKCRIGGTCDSNHRRSRLRFGACRDSWRCALPNTTQKVASLISRRVLPNVESPNTCRAYCKLRHTCFPSWFLDSWAGRTVDLFGLRLKGIATNFFNRTRCRGFFSVILVQATYCSARIVRAWQMILSRPKLLVCHCRRHSIS